jgi:parvulin-like peptidyl-prolyl isomerase
MASTRPPHTRRVLLVSALGALALASGAWWWGASAGGEAEGADVVAVVDGVEITANELADAYGKHLLRLGADRDDPAARDVILQSLVNRRLLIQAALDDGLAETEAYQAALALAETRALVDLYAGQQMGDSLQVTEDDLRRQFIQSNTVYAARHLFARDRAAAERLRARLMAGETFEALAREVFADSTLAASGGSVGEFRHDEMDPAFENAAFELPIGEVSQPVRTALGYSVIRVDSRATTPLLTETAFSTKRHQLTRYVRKRKLTEARFALSRRVLDDLAPRFEEPALDALVAMAAGRGPALDDEGLAAWRQTPLLRFTSEGLGSAWSVGTVETLAASMTDRQRAAVQDEASLREFIEGLLVREEMAARGRAAGLERAPGFRLAVAEQVDEWAFAEAKRQLRVEEVPADTLRATYDAHRDAYQMPARVQAREILVATRREADALRAQLAAGADFGALARQHSIRLGAARTDGFIGPVSRAQLGRLADPVFDAAPGEIVGPVEVAGRYALVERGADAAPRPKTFEEARDEIAAVLDVEVAQRRLLATLADLRARYSVRILPDAVARVLVFPDAAPARTPLS